MYKQLYEKIKESLISVLPLSIIVIILNFTNLVNLTTDELVIFIISALLLVVGIGLFNLGADLAMTPMGEYVGTSLTKSKKLGVLLIASFILGFFITIAEPDLSVLAKQVEEVLEDGTILIIFVGAGVALFLLLSVLKIVFKRNLASMLMFFYMLLFALGSIVIINGNEGLLPLAFDSGGVTTGPITVPFIMALGVGIALTIDGKRANENSFGLIALCSIGPMLAVLIMSMFVKGDISYSVPEAYVLPDNLLLTYFDTMLKMTKEVTIALAFIVVFFFIFQAIFIKLPKKRIKQIIIGILYTYVGLIIFLTSVNVGFMPIGYKMGMELAASKTALIIISFIIGLVVVLAEPAVHVLNKQVEQITNGIVTKKSMLIALSIGVGISICLSIIRIIFDFSILYYLIPGYFISLGLSFFVPRMYTAIAFDSGGVASGPLTSTFILPFAVGVCMVLQGQDHIMSDAFGIVSMVAMTPLITIQLLGFRALAAKRIREKIAMKRISNEDDNIIIEFM